MKKYVLALDEGTTSARSILFDKNGNTVCSAQREIAQLYPQSGYVEQDALDIYASQYATVTEIIAKSGIDVDEIAAVGITNQRETTILWERDTGKPVYNAIVWQCRRTADICEELKKRGLSDYIRKTTGLVVDAYFSGTKIKWMLDNIPNLRKRAENGEILAGTVDSWLLYKLTGGTAHMTDVTNASRTMLFDINRLCWDERLLRELDIPECILPQVKMSGEYFADIDIMGKKVPVCGIAGDQQAALFGQCCFDSGEAKNTYGTGCFLLMNTGHIPYTDTNGLIATVAATLQNENPFYALEGSVFVGGAVIQWLRDELHFIHDAADSEYFAKKISDTGGVYVVPAFTGLGAPYWNMYARGAILGLTRGSGRNHIIRAALESIAYQTNDVLRVMESDTGIRLCALRADGGASKNSLLMQFQADISDVDVVIQSSGEATAKGAAFLAGLSCGLWKDKAELAALNGGGTAYTPTMDTEKRAVLLDGWSRAVRCVTAE